MLGTTTSRCFYQKLFHHGRNCLVKAIKKDKSPCEVDGFWPNIRYISHNAAKPPESLPKLFVTPSSGLVDYKVHIRVSGLQPYETVKLSAELEENKVVFRSYAMYTADRNGQIDLFKDAAQSGSYSEVEPMGLFWSMSAPQGQRLIKKNVEIPWKVKIRVFPSLEECPADLGNAHGTSLLETHVDRSYMKSGVKRIPVKEGPFRGSIFIPEGDGPFPAVIGLSGGLVSLVEIRAALLASRGFATFSLCYMMNDHLPKHLAEIKLQYFLDVFDWYSQQPYVTSDRMGLVGLCLGGSLALWTTAHEPRCATKFSIGHSGRDDVRKRIGSKKRIEIGKIKNSQQILALEYFKLSTEDLQATNAEALFVKTVVNVNGIPSDGIVQKGKLNPYSNRLRPDLVYVTEEGVVLRDCFQVDGNTIIPVWQHGAKILILTAGDDLMTNQEFNFKFMEVCPDKNKRNIEHVHFPGAGHLIEPPYTPHCRAVNAKDRLPRMGFVADKFLGELSQDWSLKVLQN